MFLCALKDVVHVVCTWCKVFFSKTNPCKTLTFPGCTAAILQNRPRNSLKLAFLTLSISCILKEKNRNVKKKKVTFSALQVVAVDFWPDCHSLWLPHESSGSQTASPAECPQKEEERNGFMDGSQHSSFLPLLTPCLERCTSHSALLGLVTIRQRL